MRTAKTISITLPPDLLVKAQKTAEREDRTISELFREALRRYITADPEWDALLRRTRATGKTLGIATEADVERLSDEFRQERSNPRPADARGRGHEYLHLRISCLEDCRGDSLIWRCSGNSLWSLQARFWMSWTRNCAGNSLFPSAMRWRFERNSKATQRSRAGF